MPPPNPKRPPRPGPPPEAPARSKPKTEVDLPFDTAEVTPLRVDDPRPQRVAQYPAASSRRPKTADQVPTEVIQIPGELAQAFGAKTQETLRPVFLYVEKGPGAGQLVPVSHGPLIIGRSSSCDLRLQHPSISRRHAELTRTGERFFLKDLTSQNGTFVNKVRLVAEREIFAGDTLALGTAVLKLRGPMSQGAAEVTGTHAKRRGGLRLALFACTATFGLASMLLYAVLRSPSQPVASGAVSLGGPGPVAPVGPKAPIVAMPELRHAEAVPPQHTRVADAEPAPSPTDAEADAKPAARETASSAHEPARDAHPSRKTSHPATHAPAHVTRAKVQRPVQVAEADPPPTRDAPGDRGALDAYRDGELADALQQAHGALAATLTKFQSEYTAGRRALADHDAATASAHFRKALEIDHSLAGGSGTFAGILRHELDELKTLESAEAPAAPAKKNAPAARDAIDAAFGD